MAEKAQFAKALAIAEADPTVAAASPGRDGVTALRRTRRVRRIE